MNDFIEWMLLFGIPVATFFGAVYVWFPELPSIPRWIRGGIKGADPFLDDNEGLEQKALDNTWKPDEPKPQAFLNSVYNGCDDLLHYMDPTLPGDFGNTLPMGYIRVNGQRMRADAIIENFGPF